MNFTKVLAIAATIATISLSANANILAQTARDSALCEGVFGGITEKKGDWADRASSKLMAVNFDYVFKHSAITGAQRRDLVEKGIGIGIDIADGKGPKGLLASCKALVK